MTGFGLSGATVSLLAIDVFDVARSQVTTIRWALCPLLFR